MTSAFIFGLLIALMLTGMPISIALGMTVLTFIYTMTNVPTESVALKLFTGIDNFEIMAIPFFILAGNFLTHGGVARRMINFATSMVGHWYGGVGLAGVMACALIVAGDRDRDWLDHAARDGEAGSPQALRRRRDHHVRRTWHPDPAFDRDGDLLRGDRRQCRARSGRPSGILGFGRTDVHGRRHPGPHAGDTARAHDVLPRVEKRLSETPACELD